MRDIDSQQQVVNARTVVDKALAQFASRELVSGLEITDWLLDLRLVLSGPPCAEAPFPDCSPHDNDSLEQKVRLVSDP